MKLVWVTHQGESSLKLVERRSILDGQEHLRPVLNHQYIQSALAKIDLSDGSENVSVGPFSVFPGSKGSRSQIHHHHVNFTEPVENGPEGSPEFDNLELPSSQDGEDSPIYCSWSDIENDPDEVLHDVCDDITTGESAVESASMTMVMKQKILPHLTSYFSAASPQERQLLHYWITNLSGMMIPTKRSDNPFQTIYIPLALSLPSDGYLSSANAALLHAIYALSALNQAQLCHDKEEFLSLGTKHHQLSLQSLKRNLAGPENGQREALLATIITMSSIEIVKGSSSSWRIHIDGGRSLLQTMSENGWGDKSSANTLRQIFLCIEALGFDARRNSKISPVQDTIFEATTSVTSVDKDGMANYFLDKIFGIPYRVFKALMQINQISQLDCPPTSEEIDELERYIRLSDPGASPTDEGVAYDELMQHHACTFYCACLIHFHRTLKRTLPSRLQDMVRRSLYHLGVINRLEASMNVCGLLWPVFITACEVEKSSGLREDAIRLFDKGHTHGIGNINSAAAVVLEVWRRRDESLREVDISWRDVMDDLGIDILIA